jgi:hypothetical protein
MIGHIKEHVRLLTRLNSLMYVLLIRYRSVMLILKEAAQKERRGSICSKCTII